MKSVVKHLMKISPLLKHITCIQYQQHWLGVLDYEYEY
jgi:hypothetical protein